MWVGHHEWELSLLKTKHKWHTAVRWSCKMSYVKARTKSQGDNNQGGGGCCWWWWGKERWGWWGWATTWKERGERTGVKKRTTCEMSHGLWFRILQNWSSELCDLSGFTVWQQPLSALSPYLLQVVNAIPFVQILGFLMLCSLKSVKHDSTRIELLWFLFEFV